jgi:predicted Zn finger-like uncharacterized protein
MPAELVSCPECQRKLRVPNDLIGKVVKCPTCGQTFTADPARQAPPPKPPPTRQEKPARTSKVSRDDDEDDDDRSRRRRSRSGRDDDDDDRPRRRRSRYSRDDDDDDDDYDRRRRQRRDLEPHRGAAVLTLGIVGLGLTVIPVVPLGGLICAIIAWVMGNTDLGQMRAGRMDREGESQTSAGRICGIVAVVLHIVAVFLGFAWFCCALGVIGGLGGAAGRH